jgi:hypothetical protein
VPAEADTILGHGACRAVVAIVFSVTLVTPAFTAVVIFALVIIVVKAKFNRLVRPIFLEEEVNGLIRWQCTRRM